MCKSTRRFKWRVPPFVGENRLAGVTRKKICVSVFREHYGLLTY